MTETMSSIFRKIKSNPRAELYTVSIVAILFSLTTVFWQVQFMGIPYLETGNQIKSHNAVMQGTAGNPWQYRILAEYAVEGFIRFFQGMNFPHAIAVAFIFFRLLQNFLIFLIAYIYYRRLRLSTAQALMGLCILTWSMTNALDASDLQFNTYFDILFYLLAGLAILHEKPFWIIPLSVLATFNRETSGLIPLMLLATQYRTAPGKAKTRSIVAAVLSLTLYLAIFLGLRLYFGPRELVLPYGHIPGFDLLVYNLFHPVTWVMLIATLGILPFLAVFSYPRWPRGLKAFFWTVVPIWFFVHAFGGVMAETRLFLVPQALIFIPGALLLVSTSNSPSSTQGGTLLGN
ncbi:MAG: hypothetical protein ABSC61_11025 [Anaerolineales bacterium]